MPEKRPARELLLGGASLLRSFKRKPYPLERVVRTPATCCNPGEFAADLVARWFVRLVGEVVLRLGVGVLEQRSYLQFKRAREIVPLIPPGRFHRRRDAIDRVEAFVVEDVVVRRSAEDCLDRREHPLRLCACRLDVADEEHKYAP